MTCRHFIENVHDFLDARLSAREMASFSEHMEDCDRCRLIYHQYVSIQKAVAERTCLPAPSSQVMLERLRPRNWESLLTDLGDQIWTWARDLDRGLLYVRASAAPFALGLFLFLLIQFAPADTQRLAFMAMEPQFAAHHSVPRVLNVEVRQNQPEFDAMVRTAWRLPYEDSLSLLAEVQPEGHLKVEGVLEYPKSDALLSAVHAALNTSYLERANGLSNSLLIFSFQKIDVYENN